MLYTTPLLALFALLTAAFAEDHGKPARQYRRELSPERSNYLMPRMDIDPTLVCGANYVDCNNGWCCSEGETCGVVSQVPVCNGGSDIAYPFKNIEAAGSSIAALASSVYSSLGMTVPTNLASVAAATSAAKTAATTGSASVTAAAASATGTGAAGSLKAWGVGAGAVAAVVGMVV